MVLSVLK
jgi:coproporphyrinogen III oxidase-like Fe-S oxidoreductase